MTGSPDQHRRYHYWIQVVHCSDHFLVLSLWTTTFSPISKLCADALPLLVDSTICCSYLAMTSSNWLMILSMEPCIKDLGFLSRNLSAADPCLSCECWLTLQGDVICPFDLPLSQHLLQAVDCPFCSAIGLAIKWTGECVLDPHFLQLLSERVSEWTWCGSPYE